MIRVGHRLSLICACLLFLAGNSHGQSLGVLVDQGDWLKVAELVAVTRDVPVDAVLHDIATHITQAVRTKENSSTQYDFPYSNATAMQEVSNWIEAEKNSELDLRIPEAVVALKGGRDTARFNRLAAELVEDALSPQEAVFILGLRGVSLAANGRITDATELFDRALKIDPMSSVILVNLGTARLKEGKEREAERYFIKALEGNGVDALTYFNVGSYYFYKRNLPLAKNHLQRSTELAPTMLEAWYNLGGVYLQLGETQQGVQALKKVLEIDSSSQYADGARKYIKRFGG